MVDPDLCECPPYEIHLTDLACFFWGKVCTLEFCMYCGQRKMYPEPFVRQWSKTFSFGLDVIAFASIPKGNEGGVALKLFISISYYTFTNHTINEDHR